MQFNYLSKSFVFLLCSLWMPSVFCTPLTIEITDGIEATPFETGDVDQTISSSFVQTIDAKDIRDTQLTLNQIIENNSGIKIRSFGGIGSYSQLSIRGKSSDQIMVYVDGMLINNASGGSVDLSQIPVNQIARIEIYKDVIPVEFSEASNGGVINIITHRTTEKKSSRVGAGSGSFDTYNFNLTHFNYHKNWRFILSSAYVESENNFPFNYENGTFRNPNDDEIQKRQNNQLKQYNVAAKAKHQFSKYQSIQYQAELFNKRKNIPSFSNSDKTRAFLTFDNQSFNINYINRHFISNALKIGANGKVDFKNTVYDDQEKQIGLDKRLVKQKSTTASGKFYLKYQQANYQLIGNNSLRHEQLSLEDVFEPENSRENRRTTISTAIEGHFYFLNKNLIISPASRFYISHDKFKGKTLNDNPEKNSLGKTYYTISPQIGARYKISNNTNIKINAGKYYRLPNFVELFGARGYIGSNESLEPEEGINLDIGFEHLKYPKSEKFTQLGWNLSAFHSFINNEIVYKFDARGIGKPSNNNKSTITGIENNLSLELYYDLTFTSNTNLQLPINRSDPEDLKILPGRSLWSQTSRFTYVFDKIELFIEHAWESAFYLNSAQEISNNEKSIFNTSIKLHNKKMQYSLALNNIFDEQYKDYYFQVAPGRSIFFSANINFN